MHLTASSLAAAPKKTQRIIGHIIGDFPGPTVVFFAAIHGNEPAGVRALEQVFDTLTKVNSDFYGQCYGILGNTKALEEGVRFLEKDLNRMWLPHQMGTLLQDEDETSPEGEEMRALYQLIEEIRSTAKPPLYFIDLHTTSGVTEPFVVMNDSLLNRRFTQHYPLPVILGIEEYLTGALLSHINEMGYVSIGFESGQHQSEAAVSNAVHFINYTLGLVGFIKMDSQNLKRVRGQLKQRGKALHRFYEIYYQHLLKVGIPFAMTPGFTNFEFVPKGTLLAKEGGQFIITRKKRQLFMPLYQDKGYEGYYFIRSIPLVFLGLSQYVRRARLDALLVGLPGVRWASPKKSALIVDRRIARFFAKSFFHLLGYRTRVMDQNHWVLKSRERNSRTGDYRGEGWW